MASGSYRNDALKASSRLSAVSAAKDGSGVPGRVRVDVRLRPRNTEELVADADCADCVELQPELKRLKLRKNNWDFDTFEFDEVLTESASQKRVYEVVAKPVVESILEGYNGTVMAYGQTGTGKTFTVGSLGEGDTATRGIMVRAMEDILADTSPNSDTISVSYLQLYMETVQDLLVPGNDNIAISEDPKTGDVSAPGATVVEIRNQKSFIELLRLGEAHRFAANTKLNTESSRSHSILMVHVKRSIKGRNNGEVDHLSENEVNQKSESEMTVIKPEDMKLYIWLQYADGSIQQVEEEVAIFCPVICREILQSGMGSSKNYVISLPEELAQRMWKGKIKLKRIKEREKLAAQQASEKSMNKPTSDQARRKRD